MLITTAKKKAVTNSGTGKNGKNSKNGKNGKNSKNKKKNENLGINLV